MAGTTADPLSDHTLDPARFAPYELVELLGEGSYAHVYLARNQGVRPRFAVKILKEQYARDPKDRQTFLDEANLLYRISQDRVISARHVDAQGVRPWFVMDLADHGTLDAWVTKHKAASDFELSLEQLVGLGVELCECLSALHDYDVVHYDLKPHNVLIRGLGQSVDHQRGSIYRLPPDQRLMLGDLGLARTTDDLNDRLGGSPRYIAPEIFDDHGDERSDLFALGIMLYEFAHPGTGDGPVRPYEGRRPSANPRDRRSLADPSIWGPYQPLRDVRPNLPADFDKVVSRALAPEPHQRYGNASELKWALDRLLRRPTPERATARTADLVRGVDDVLTTARDGIGRLSDAGLDVYQWLDAASDRLRRRPQIAVLSNAGVESSSFTLFLAGEPIAATAPTPYGSVISYIREGKPERAIAESQRGESDGAPLERDRHNRLQADLDIEEIRRLTLELDHSALRGIELVDIPMAIAEGHLVSQAVSLADLVVVLTAGLDTARDAVPSLREAARRSVAGPCGLIVVDAASPEFGGAIAHLAALEDLGFQQALGMANAGLTLRVFFQQMLEGAGGRYIAASAALALCEKACAETNDWPTMKAFVDGRDELEHEFPELRDLRYLREEVRADFVLPLAYARELRRTLSQPTAAGKLGLAFDQAGPDTVRTVAEDRLFEWMTALADGTIPAESATAARVVVASLRRLQDAETV